MKKKLLAISGSPRKGGNTEVLLGEALRASKEAGVDSLLLRAAELRLSPCTACGGCWKNGECVQEDDMRPVYPRLLEAHYLVVASPLYFMGVSAQLKAMIDRCQALWARRLILKKYLRNNPSPSMSLRGAEPRSNLAFQPKGLFISAAALKKGDKIFAGSIQTIKALFHVLGVEYKGEVLCCGLEEREAVKGHPELLEKVYQATLQLLNE